MPKVWGEEYRTTFVCVDSYEHGVLRGRFYNPYTGNGQSFESLTDFLVKTEQMLDEMCATLGGRAAEEVFIGQISTGAMNDLERVTKQAYGMIAYAGMSDKLPNLCYYNNDEYSFNKPYSERTAELIDEEVKQMINEQYERAKTLLLQHQEGHSQLAQLLIEKEVIFAEDVEKIFGKRPWASRSEEIMNKEEGQFLPTNGQEEKSESENKEE